MDTISYLPEMTSLNVVMIHLEDSDRTDWTGVMYKQ